MRPESTTRRGRPASGTLELRKSGYFARLTVTVDGERVRKWFELGTHDKGAAKRKMARLAKQSGEGVLNVHALASESKRIETYAEAAQRIRALRRLGGKRAVSEEEGHDRMYINTVIGALPVTDVRPAHIRQMLEEARDVGELSAKSLANIRASASIVFRKLMKEEVITTNPVSLVDAEDVPARVDRRERVVLTDEELALYLAWEHPDERMGVFVEQRQTMSLVSRLLGGARTGDLHALTWQSFDLEEFAFGWLPRKKTERPQRMHIEPVLRPYLRRWWERLGSPRTGLVFPRMWGPGAGEVARPKASHAEGLRRDLKRAMGLEVYKDGAWVEAIAPAAYTQRQRELFLETEYTKPVDFHSWRRAYNQALADAGANAQQAAALAGHASLDAHAKYLRNTAKAARLPDAAVPRLGEFRPGPRTLFEGDPRISRGLLVGPPGLEPRTSPL